MSNAKPKTAITPTRAENYPEWYQQVIDAADLAENSEVRGCMVIKPWGYRLWENVQRGLDDMFKATGHENAYFPLFIPVSLMEKEASHVEGFAKECAVVTHHRLEARKDDKGVTKLVPAGPLEEPLVVRPTSETIIGESFAKWVKSYRDLPLLINQWANVVRWEMRTRLFLRTAEFLWQEGHTAHATQAEAIEETMKMLGVYAEFAESWMAIPVIQGEKTAGERFPGAVQTWCIEAMMQDRKALQAGTSHFLGQNFAKGSNIKFLDENNQLVHAWTTSWGVSTRLIGAMIMTHADDDGMVMPPKLSPQHVAILPVTPKPEDRERVIASCRELKAQLEQQTFAGGRVRVIIDDRDMRGGEKKWHWVKKGVPVRVEVGARDLDQGTVAIGRRDVQLPKDQAFPQRAAFVEGIGAMLQSIHDNLFQRALAFRQEHTRTIDSKDEFYAYFTEPKTDKPNSPTAIHGGFVLAHFNGDPKLEAKIKDDLKVTVRCIPRTAVRDPSDLDPGTCPFTGEPSKQRVVWAKSY
ncbi:MAG: proline--tRNA ligase [Deltaproteobacteria bacterium]|nr:proline--tRNA ligase [Deltaproteobacteria bacterium]